MNRTWRPKPHRQAVARALAWGAAVGVPLLGALGLAGVTLDLALADASSIDLPLTTPRTHVSLILGGLALGLRLPRAQSSIRQWLSRTSALGMAFIGSAGLMLDLLGIEPFAWGIGPRPSPLTGTSLLLLGVALLLPAHRPVRTLARDAVTLLALLVALLGLNGLLLGTLVAKGMTPFPAQRGMGLHTSLALLLLGLGVLCVQPERGLVGRITQDSLGGFLARRLVPVAMLGPTLLGAMLVLMFAEGLLGRGAPLPIFATLLSAGGVMLVLLSARALDVLEVGRQRATSALAASESRYRGLLETTPTPLLMVDPQGRLRFVNSEAERLFGHPRDSLLGQSVDVLVPAGLVGQDRAEGETVEHTLRGVRGDGADLHLEARLRPVESPEGMCLLVALRDVTEREHFISRLEHAREEAEMQRGLLQAVVNHAPVGVLFIDPTKRLTVTNPFAETMLGRGPGGIERGAYLGRVRALDGRPLTLEELPSTRVFRTGKVVGPQEVLIVRPEDGKTMPVLITAAPVPGSHGGIRGVVVTGQDLTPRKELERLREEYVSLISHDLRTPLQGITLRASLLRRHLREHHLPREESMTEAILRDVGWMSGMIEEMLEGSRMESRGLTLRRKPVDLARFLEEALERDLPPALRERFRLEVATPLPIAWLDTARVERVLSNLLTNAAKYGPPDRPVEVRVVTRDSEAVVSVRDEGAGLTPEEAEHIFDKYYRTRQGSAADTHGLGLGLYISRLIVEAHGGRIWVVSAPGQGATFCFSLPLCPPGGDAPSMKAGSGPEGVG
ncbi:ATP-binding protein [Myxococcus sp. K15C18031901]|uniref:sensor histidine kinase n=1 Tax=Myxococcus dinghuensis TaxID=2906761 RepID=UPI0020A811C0|nr:ATP-binding protein [Myxococcus dinghuensis]MCP3099051.1 ATP-binding protein [Myxococcus dinghuensis]